MFGRSLVSRLEPRMLPFVHLVHIIHLHPLRLLRPKTVQLVSLSAGLRQKLDLLLRAFFDDHRLRASRRDVSILRYSQLTSRMLMMCYIYRLWFSSAYS
jgi:hypothetical protein